MLLVGRPREERLATSDAEQRLPAGRVRAVEDQVLPALEMSAELVEQPWRAADLYAPDVVGALLPPHDPHRPVAAPGTLRRLRGEEHRQFRVAARVRALAPIVPRMRPA